MAVAIAAFSTSEWQLSRQLYAQLQSEDVVVADSADGTDVDLALVRSREADAVFRKIMRGSVIFGAARTWAWAIILCSGNVHLTAHNL